MNKRKTIISLILTFLVLLVGMGIYKKLANTKKIDSNDTLKKEVLRSLPVRQLEATTAENQITIDGRLKAYRQVNLSANVSGVLLATSPELKKGMYFKKGSLLFDIDQRKAIYNLYALRSSLLNAITLIMPDLKIDHPAAFVNWKKYIDEFDVEKPVQSLPTLTNEQEKFLVAARNIYNLYYNIKSAEAQLADYKIYAPFSGVITQASIFSGAMVMPGQPLAMMMNTNLYELEAPIREKDLAAIQAGNVVVLNSDISNQSWTGKVARISNQIDPTTQSILVYIQVSGKGLKEGMFLKGQIKGSPLKEVVKISKDYIVNQEYVYTVKDSILQLQKINIQNLDQEWVYVADFGSDNWMVNQDPRGLFEGQKVVPIYD